MTRTTQAGASEPAQVLDGRTDELPACCNPAFESEKNAKLDLRAKAKTYHNMAVKAAKLQSPQSWCGLRRPSKEAVERAASEYKRLRAEMAQCAACNPSAELADVMDSKVSMNAMKRLVMARARALAESRKVQIDWRQVVKMYLPEEGKLLTNGHVFDGLKVLDTALGLLIAKRESLVAALPSATSGQLLDELSRIDRYRVWPWSTSDTRLATLVGISMPLFVWAIPITLMGERDEIKRVREAHAAYLLDRPNWVAQKLRTEQDIAACKLLRRKLGSAPTGVPWTMEHEHSLT